MLNRLTATETLSLTAAAVDGIDIDLKESTAVFESIVSFLNAH
jgi:hypothetical protein